MSGRQSRKDMKINDLQADMKNNATKCAARVKTCLMSAKSNPINLLLKRFYVNKQADIWADMVTHSPLKGGYRVF
jgi:hypothetical protein